MTSLSRWRHIWRHWRCYCDVTGNLISNHSPDLAKKHSFLVAMTTSWLPWKRVPQDFFCTPPWASHHSQSRHLFYHGLKNHFFLVAMEAAWLPWKPMPLGSKLTHRRPSCRVWCLSVCKWRRSLRTNNNTEFSNCSMIQLFYICILTWCFGL